MTVTAARFAWSGIVTAVQPRIRLTRSFDQRSHTYQGHALRVRGSLGEEQREFLVAIGEAAHAVHQLRAGDQMSGKGVPVVDPRTEIAQLYRVSKLTVLEHAPETAGTTTPWLGVPPSL